MKKMINETRIEGYLYDHDLKLKVSGENSKTPGVEYINGTISIATDEDLINVIQVHFSYEPAVRINKTSGTRKDNRNFELLKRIATGDAKLAVKVGKEADKVRVDSAIGLNEFYDKDNKLVSTKRNEGGFIHPVTQGFSDKSRRSYFKTDIIITGARMIEANEERNTPEKMKLVGYIFDFRKNIMPTEFTILKPEAMAYFESLEPSPKNPIFTCVWGEQKNQTIKTKIVTESAFGDAEVIERKTSERDFIVNHAIVNPYEWDSPETILASEVSEAIANREIALAEIKKRQDDYKASINKNSAAAVLPNDTGLSDEAMFKLF